MGKYKRLLSNTAILGAGTFTSKVLVFLLMPLYTALLSADEYGTADILTQAAKLLIPLVSLGVSDGLFRFALDGDPLRRKRIFSNGVFVILCGTLPLSIIVLALGKIDIFGGYEWLLIFYVCAANLHYVCAEYVRACNMTAIFALQGIINTVLTIGLNVLFLVRFDMGVLGYVLSVAVADTVTTVILVIVCKLYRELTFKPFDKKLLWDMLKFSIPYIPTTMMWMITSASDRFIVTAYSGTAENGLYAAAYKLPTLILLAGGVFMEAWHLSSVKDVNEKERSKFFEKVYKNYTGIIFIGGALLVAMSKPLTVMLMNSSYYSSWRYVPLLSISMVFSSLASFMGSVYFLEKKSLRSFLTASVGTLVNIVLNFILIPSYGGVGAAAATAVSYASVYAIRAYDTGKYLKFKLYLPRIIINTVALTVQAISLMNEVTYWVDIQIGIVIFMLIFNGREMTEAVVRTLKSLKKRKKS